MKQIITLSLSLLAATVAHAQITIGQNEMPHENDQLVRVQAVTNPFINFSATGPAHTWNFANLAAAQGDTTRYQTVASTNFIYAIVYADVFFNGNRANHAKSGTDIPFSQLLSIQNPYTFRFRSNSVYKTVGYGVELSGIPVPIIFDDQDEIYQLPIHFGDADVSHSSYHIEIPNVGYYGFQQDRANEVDGWGAITTPGGTWDVLRVKTTLNMSDTITGFAIDRPVAHEYKWLAQDLRVPVLQVNTTTLFGTEVVTAIYYYDVPRSIAVVQPLANVICPGSTVPVHYEVSGAFNAGGFFVPANHFTAQLSDATGSFAAPVVIGDVIATGSGIINATIPANTPPGSGYRIRVISSSPGYIGTSNTFNITIGGTTTASITAAGPTMICTGDTLELTAVGGPGYQWQLDGNDITGATDAVYAAVEAGSYTVVVDNACGTATSNAFALEVNEPPVQGVSTTSAFVCAGNSIALSVEDQSGQTPLDYQWYLNGAPIVGETGTSVNASLAGQYTAEATNNATGCSYTSEGIMLEVQTVPAPQVQADGTTEFCSGGSVGLSFTATPPLSYQWYMNGDALPGATDESLSVSEAGAYTVIATSVEECSSMPSEAIEVVVNALPATSGITATGSTTFCAGGEVVLLADVIPDVTYQWTWNGDPIAGADSASVTATESGSYGVVVTSAQGCSATSDPELEVTANPIPAQPVVSISLTNDTLFASGTGSFQWYFNGVAISGANDAWFIPVDNGTYTVEVTENGCSNTSEGFAFISTSLEAGAVQAARVSPNPCTGAFMIDLPQARGQAFEILDATGKRVHAGRITGMRTQVDLGHVEDGMYFLRMTDTRIIPVVRISVLH